MAKSFKNLEHMLTTARVFGHCFDPAEHPPQICSHSLPGEEDARVAYMCVRCEMWACLSCENYGPNPDVYITRKPCDG